MKKVFIFFTDGFETVEALTPVDVLRRGGCNVITVSVTGKKEVTSAQNVTIHTDALFDEIAAQQADMLVLPGGPGTSKLFEHEDLKAKLQTHFKQHGLLGAICAAPMILGRLGMLKQKHATCFPGYEKDLLGATFTGKPCEVDGNIITARGAGVSLQFGLALLKALSGENVADEIKQKMQADF